MQCQQVKAGTSRGGAIEENPHAEAQRTQRKRKGTGETVTPKTSEQRSESNEQAKKQPIALLSFSAHCSLISALSV